MEESRNELDVDSDVAMLPAGWAKTHDSRVEATRYTYRRLFSFFILFQKASLNAVLLDSIAFLERMSVPAAHTVVLTISTIAIDPLDSEVSLSI